MTLVVAWLVFPSVLVALSFGSGLLIERIARIHVPAALLVPIGLATITGAGSLCVSLPATAKLTTPLVAALAAAGFVVGRKRAPEGWAIGTAVVVYLAYGAPVLASGSATFAGYVKLDDTATFLALTDRMLDHGRNLAGLAPSSYEATLSINIAHGYPLGGVLPLGIGHQLVRADAAWLYQPWLSFCAAVVALCLYELAAPLIGRRPVRAFVAAVAAQAALLYGYALWGGVKELAGAALIATAAALSSTLRPPGRFRSLLPFAVACAAVFDTLSAGAVVWLLPLTLPLIRLFRRSPTAVAAGLAAIAVLALPALATAGDFLGASNRASFENSVVLGNLVRPLRPLQIVGIWPNGDFRLDPHARVATALLVALAIACALGGLVVAFTARARALLLAMASTLTGALVFVLVGAPWLGAKALAIGSPVVLLVALCGCVSLLSNTRLFAGSARTTTVIGSVAACALAGGVVWSDALAFHDVDLAPRGQLAELERIGDMFAGQGPALMTEYQPYGVRHFLRRLDAEGVSELRRRRVPLRNGSLAGKAEYVDLDQLAPSAVQVYRTLVLRRSPTQSRPPLPYQLAWKGSWYEVWQRRSLTAPLAHVPLGDALEPAASPPCSQVRRLERRGRVVAPSRPLNLVWPLGPSGTPQGWSALRGGSVVPTRGGTLALSIGIRRSGRYRLWVGGSIRGKLTARLDNRDVGSVTSQLQNAGQWLNLGAVQLRRGTHRVSLIVSLRSLRPGTGGDSFPLGPLLLQPSTRAELLAPARATTLCGRTLDWLEVLAR